MNKILTVSIAAYNVQNYIENTLKSVLVNNIDDLEVLVEDDGGTDNTANIVKEYEEKYPGIVKLVHKDNGGYGSTINKSVELAAGKYFKQLDGDDWYESNNFEKLLELLRTVDVDAVYTPRIQFVEGRESYTTVDHFEKDVEGKYNIEEIIVKRKDNVMMHDMLYKTDVIRKTNIKLLEHCLYTDTEYALFNLMTANTIYITHLPIYVYRIGRDEQSISVKSHIKHYEDHIKVSKEILKFYNNNNDKFEKNKLDYLTCHVRKQMADTLTAFILILDPSKENLKILKEYDNYILKENKHIYDEMEKQSKIVKILRKTNYNYFIYKHMSKAKKKKIEGQHH